MLSTLCRVGKDQPQPNANAIANHKGGRRIDFGISVCQCVLLMFSAARTLQPVWAQRRMKTGRVNGLETLKVKAMELVDKWNSCNAEC